MCFQVPRRSASHGSLARTLCIPKVLEKSWVSAMNYRRVSKSRRRKLESRNLELAKNKAGLGISIFEI